MDVLAAADKCLQHPDATQFKDIFERVKVLLRFCFLVCVFTCVCVTELCLYFIVSCCLSGRADGSDDHKLVASFSQQRIIRTFSCSRASTSRYAAHNNAGYNSDASVVSASFGLRMSSFGSAQTPHTRDKHTHQHEHRLTVQPTKSHSSHGSLQRQPSRPAHTQIVCSCNGERTGALVNAHEQN